MTHPTRHLTLTAAALIVVLITFAMGCDLLTPEEPDELDPESDFDDTLSAAAIWQRYQRHPQYANDEFQGLWANIHLDGIRREDGVPAGVDAVTGKALIIRAPGKLGALEFIFRFREDTKEYKRGMQPIVLCNVKGTDILREKLQFVHCRPATKDTPKPPTPEPTPTRESNE